MKEPQIIGPGDCLPKTHGYANSQEDVYGLTPARCRKVKRRANRKRRLELKPRGKSGPKAQPNGVADGRNGKDSVTGYRSDVETEK